METMQLQQAVRDELAAEPRIDAREVAVSVTDDGVVSLRGTVGSLRQKRDAGQTTKRVKGVQDVNNDLEVRPLIGDRRDDAVLRGEVLQALVLNSLVPSGIDARVKDAVVTLTGTINWNFERMEAEATASNVRGVRAIRPELVLIPTAKVEDIKTAIQDRFERNASIDSNNVSAETVDGKVILTGYVSSWAARDAAVEGAWSVPNVTEVQDRLLILY